MLLAADYKTPDGKDAVELLEAPWAEPGTVISLEGEADCVKPAEISGNDFFKVQISIKDGNVNVAGKNLLVNGKAVTASKALNGPVS